MHRVCMAVRTDLTTLKRANCITRIPLVARGQVWSGRGARISIRIIASLIVHAAKESSSVVRHVEEIGVRTISIADDTLEGAIVGVCQ